jgi:hypothetical protein
MNRNRLMPVKSRLDTVATVAITPKIAAVPPKAVMMSWAPLEKPRIEPIIRDSIRPMKNVKPSSSATPMPLFLNLSIAKKNPKATPMNTAKPISGLPAKKEKPVVTPIHAPSTVGTMDRASSR